MKAAAECSCSDDNNVANGAISGDANWDDRVVHLREWGTDIAHVVPGSPFHHGTAGAARTYPIRIHDPSGDVADLETQLVRDRAKWLLYDVGGRSGLSLDGSRRTDIVLEPGAEIGIGNLTLVAESHRSMALRKFLRRLLGWTDVQSGAVDLALRSIRFAETRRAALVLCGSGDLLPIAQSLHRRVLGAERPFILCDPRRVEHKANVRSAETYKDGMLALLAATGGSLCVRTQHMPPHFAEVTALLRDPRSRVQLVVCAQAPRYCEPFLAAPIMLPALVDRAGEVDRIILEYADDAYVQFGIRRFALPPEDHDWVRRNASSSLADIEKATLRLIALRAFKTVTGAAVRLGMAQVSLARWIQRRRPPIGVTGNRHRVDDEADTHEPGHLGLLDDPAAGSLAVAKTTTKPYHEER